MSKLGFKIKLKIKNIDLNLRHQYSYWLNKQLLCHKKDVYLIIAHAIYTVYVKLVVK